MNYANFMGNIKRAWDYGESQFRNAKNDLSKMQFGKDKQKRPVFISDIQIRRRGLEMLALSFRGGRVL